MIHLFKRLCTDHGVLGHCKKRNGEGIIRIVVLGHSTIMLCLVHFVKIVSPNSIAESFVLEVWWKIRVSSLDNGASKWKASWSILRVNEDRTEVFDSEDSEEYLRPSTELDEENNWKCHCKDE